MLRARLRGYLGRIREELYVSFTQEHTPKEVAGSFAVGVFITMLPTLGTGLLLFVLLTYLFDQINKAAIFASVIVVNPVVKWGVYAGSLALGIFLLGPVEVAAAGELSGAAGWDVILRLLVGNTILAIVATAIAYVAALRLTIAYRERELDFVEESAEQMLDPPIDASEP